MLRNFIQRIDWILLGAIVPLLLAGLVTMNSFFDASSNYFFDKQLIWIGIGLALFFVLSFLDYRFLRRTGVIVSLFIGMVVVLLLLFFVGKVAGGAQSWYDFGLFSFQPSDLAKLILILVLAKYFTRRHIEIANIKHIIISGIYALVFFVLVFLQPDFGSAIIIFLVWFGMVLVSGISKKHLLMVFAIGLITFTILWTSVFQDYQKQRIKTFINPYTDIQGAGYNAYQSTIAVGSGQIFGKGLGYGTQSRLKFLPEYQTDFIFAAYAEEWGFVGVILLFLLLGVVIWRILKISFYGSTNFEILFGLGLSILIMSHVLVHVGMNIGLLPVTGTTIPFLSYGGSHTITIFVGLGILMGMRSYGRAVHKDSIKNEMVGI